MQQHCKTLTALPPPEILLDIRSAFLYDNVVI